MNNFLAQPSGATNKGPNKAAIARIFGIKDNEVTYLDKRLPIDGYKVLFDPTTQLCFWNTSATGTPTTWSVSNDSISITTTNGEFALFQSKTTPVVTVETIDDLRSFEPYYAGQEIFLKRAVINGPILNEKVVYDSTDTASSDDTVTTVVTTNGARWKFDISKGLNPLLFGFTTAANNLDVCINNTVNLIVNNFVANNGVVLKTSTIKLGALYDGTSIFNFNVGVVTSSFIVFHFDTEITFLCSSGINAFIFDNAKFTKLGTGWSGTNNSWIDMQRATRQLFTGAYLTIVGSVKQGDDYTKTNTVGIFFGNSAPNFMAFRNQTLSNFSVTGFNRGFIFGTFDTYICAIANVALDRNVYNLAVDTLAGNPDGTDYSGSNSGERFIIDNALIADALQDNIYVAIRGGEYNISNSSIDYPTRDHIRYNSYGIAAFLISHTHIEGNVNGAIVNLPSATYAVPLFRTVRFMSCYIDIITAQVNWCKKHFYSAVDYFTVQIDRSSYVHYSNSVASIPMSAYPALAPYDNTNLILIDWQRDSKEISQQFSPISCYSKKNMRNVAVGTFLGTTGNAYTFRLNNYDTDYMSTTNGPDIRYGEVGTDGAQCIKFGSSTAFDVWLTCNVPITPGTMNDLGRVAFSFRDDGLTGTLNAQAAATPVIIPTATSTFNSTDSTVTTTLSNKALSATLSSTVACTDWSNKGMGKGNWQGIMLPPVIINRSSNTVFGNIQYFTLGIRFTGGPGNFSIKLPTFFTDSLTTR